MEEEDISDFISNLPYELLQVIVSLIPFKEAIKTSILSTTWRQIWRPCEMNLEFNAHEITSFGATQKLNQITGSFVNSSYDPHALKLFLTNPKSPFLMATKGLNHEELHLEFFSKDELVLSSINLVSEQSVISHKPNKLSSLKTLNLKSITHLADNYISVLFSNCLVLESLKIEKCKGLKNINIKANSCLKRFIAVDCPSIDSITICAPNLKSFWYQGVLPKIEFENTPQLVDVVLNLRDGLGNIEFDCEDVLSFLASLEDIETLTISGWLIEIDQSYPSITWPMFHQYWHEPHLWMDCETVLKSNYASQLSHLKLINIVGFKPEEDHLLLMELLLHKSLSLKEMTVNSALGGGPAHGPALVS
ncbi:hypothetical protein LguiB_015669 [Lonicera macranthoides]